MKNVQLDNGKWLMVDNHRLGSGLTFLSDANKVEYSDVSPKAFNLPFSNKYLPIKKLVGDFWVSKKGTKCFGINPNGKHVLINGYDVSRFDAMDGMVYYHKARSNGGGIVMTYAVVSIDWVASYSIDDI